ncbi:MAG TPA: hypothetical protein VHO91_00420 [Rhodopila sp.]|nr:hypothetical protein [Rhodopila sp.]
MHWLTVSVCAIGVVVLWRSVLGYLRDLPQETDSIFLLPANMPTDASDPSDTQDGWFHRLGDDHRSLQIDDMEVDNTMQAATSSDLLEPVIPLVST